MNFFSHLSNSIGGLEILFSWRLIVAALLGMCMGLERSMAGKHAGMRTYAMVSVGAALFVTMGTLSAYALSVFPGINPLQLAGSVIIGIGFIGSGLAMAHKEQPIELTTASGIWVVAGVGMACGFGFYVLAITATVVSVVVFTFFSRVERKLRARYGIKVK
ncbi:MAG: MgtC/SapB family protein [Candidatus Adlerbacteria bacterium]|nr:MgtC/SapB family protein [Candidatus Adlerbacteria bacterium]